VIDPAMHGACCRRWRLNLKSLDGGTVAGGDPRVCAGVHSAGEAGRGEAKAWAARFNPLFPSASGAVNRESAQLWFTAVAGDRRQGMSHLAKSTTQEDQLYTADFAESAGQRRWTMDQRKAYFAFINHAQANYKGGASSGSFWRASGRMRIKTCTDEEVKAARRGAEGRSDCAGVKETRRGSSCGLGDVGSAVGDSGRDARVELLRREGGVERRSARRVIVLRARGARRA